MTETTFKNRIVETGEADPAQLLANPANFRRHTGAQQASMTELLGSIGWVQDVLVNRRTGHVLDGHMRIELAMRQDQPTVPVSYVDLSDEEEKVVLATFDPVGAMARVDQDALRDLLGETGDRLKVGGLAGLAAELQRRSAPETDTSWLDQFRADAGAPDPKPPAVRPEVDAVSVSYTVTPDERSVIVRALNRVKADRGLETAAQALVALCREVGDDA